MWGLAGTATSNLAATNVTANCDVDAGLTLIVAVVLDVAPRESVTVRLKVNEVTVVTQEL